MFKKDQNIDQEFMQYNNDVPTQVEKTEKVEKSFLSTIIQSLTILLLLGVLIVGGVFGYRFLQDSSSSNATKSEVEDDVLLPVKDESKEQKMYTKNEVQAMMNEMMAKASQEQHLDSADISKSTDNDSLLASLENREVDQMQDLNLELDLNKGDNSKKVTTENSDENVDHYNKIVVKHGGKAYASVDKLSQDISRAVQEMETKSTVKSTYTKSITKEVTVRENEMRIIVVKSGDTLSKIAKRAYGSATAYDRIYKANPDLIKNPNHIFIGQRLRVPLSKN